MQILVGQKRKSFEVEDEESEKRVKMRDLESVFRSEGEFHCFIWNLGCVFFNISYKDLSFLHLNV